MHRYQFGFKFVFGGFCRIHQTLRVTPAMQAGAAKHVWELEDIIRLIDFMDTEKSAD